MALRTINGTIRDRSGNAYPNGLVLFKLDESVYSTTATYLAGTTQVLSNAVGVITTPLWGPATYQVVEPNGTTYTITVPDGSPDTPLQLEVLRAAGDPTAEPQSTFDAMLDSTLGEDVVDALLAAGESENPPTTANPVATIADLNAAASGIVMADAPETFTLVFDDVTVGASPESAIVDVEEIIEGAATKSGFFAWVRAAAEDAIATFVFAGGIPTITLNAGEILLFQVFVPLTSGTFTVTATGNGSTVNLRIYPQAVL